MSLHIKTEYDDDIAKLVIMPGDPVRVKFIAENYLDDYKLVNNVRVNLAYTGYFKGVKITVMASGMGCPSMAIYAKELFDYYNVEKIIRVGSCGSYYDEIDVKSVILAEKAYTLSNFSYQYDGKEIDLISASSFLNQKIIENAKKSDKEEKQKILEYLNWKYPHEEIEGVPTKTSVTKIKEMVNAEQVEEQTKNVKFAVEETKEAKAITQKPKFVNNNENAKISNAQKGTLMHLCVQKMNEKEEYTAEKIQELIDELKRREIISKAEAESINIGKLQGYTKSDLWQELKNAKEIHKEKAFYINVKASRMYDISKENDENILVQGIIDLYYIDKNGKLVLVDYKTDYVEAGKENELVEKYKEQLYLYKDALEKALNRKVDRMWIYSLYLNESIVIEK